LFRATTAVVRASSSFNDDDTIEHCGVSSASSTRLAPHRVVVVVVVVVSHTVVAVGYRCPKRLDRVVVLLNGFFATTTGADALDMGYG
jgi:hypothetical protein